MVLKIKKLKYLQKKFQLMSHRTTRIQLHHANAKAAGRGVEALLCECLRQLRAGLGLT